jgi:hypothetical protein
MIEIATIIPGKIINTCKKSTCGLIKLAIYAFFTFFVITAGFLGAIA